MQTRREIANQYVGFMGGGEKEVESDDNIYYVYTNRKETCDTHRGGFTVDGNAISSTLSDLFATTF